MTLIRALRELKSTKTHQKMIRVPDQYKIVTYKKTKSELDSYHIDNIITLVIDKIFYPTINLSLLFIILLFFNNQSRTP
ncbi:unnamed protein product [Rotaria socialis]